MAGLISTAISGLRLSQLALSISGQNIVNANTEGYSRQSISSATSIATRTGAGYVGTGVTVTDIYRNTQRYLVDQVSQDISVLSDFDAYLSNISQTDNVLASASSSLSTTLNNFFDALNESANDPASLLGRQLLLTQTNMLTQGFRTLEEKLLNQNMAVNKQIDSIAANVTTMAKEIAGLNKAIGDAAGASTSRLPNDLLDRRDQLVRDLSKFVSVTVVPQGNETIDVFIGEGQGLVIGPNPQVLLSVPGSMQADRKELAFNLNGAMRVVTDQLTGGELGGLTRFRREALDPALNALGRISLALADGLNRQQALGVDLEGNLGSPLLTDINSPDLMKNRVRADIHNATPHDRRINVSIDDVSKLTTSNYDLSFPGPGSQYSLIRQSDGKLVAQGVLGEKLPHTIEVDGLSIALASGSFQQGDRFQIQPTRTGASDVRVLITRPEAFAFASPVRTHNSLGNQGGAFILPGIATDISTAAFTTRPGQLSPPIIIRFTSPTTYDVLDNSNPANPVSLKPPLNNQHFSPGVVNNVFPDDPGGTTISSLGGAAARLVPGTRNGYQQETLSVLTTDPVTGHVKETRMTIQQNQTAAQIAQQLSGLDGVTANASSQMLLTDFRSDGSGIPLSLMLNGVDLTDPSYIPDGTLLPETVPDPLTPDFLRDRINNSAELRAMGIHASSDGVSLMVRSTTGVDLRIEVGGNAGDSFSIRDGDLRSARGSTNLGKGMTIPVNTGFEVDLGMGPQRVTLTPGSFAGADVQKTIQQDLDYALGKGAVVATVNAAGQLELRSVNDQRALSVHRVSGGDPLGIAPIMISGPDTGPQPGGTRASLAGKISIGEGFDFAAGGPHRFDIAVDGQDPVTVELDDTAVTAVEVLTQIENAINTALAANGPETVTVGVNADGFLVISSNTSGAASAVSISNVIGTHGALFPGNASGKALRSEFTLGGTLDVQLAANVKVTSDRATGLFGSEPKALSYFMGYQISINSGQGEGGAPVTGDSFLVSYNTDGSADNRNGTAMLSLNTALTLADGNFTYQGAYGQLLENLGILTSQARLSQGASETLLRQSMSALQSVAGVNVDEEAALLIQFEQHYNASARLITLAREMFDSLLSL